MASAIASNAALRSALVAVVSVRAAIRALRANYSITFAASIEIRISGDIILPC